MNAKETLVYRELNSRLTHYSSLSIWLSHNYEKKYWTDILDKEQRKIDEIRQWAKKLPWGMVRHYYLSWIRWYYQFGIWEARWELFYKSNKRRMDRYYKRQNKRRESLAAFGENIPRPPAQGS